MLTDEASVTDARPQPDDVELRFAKADIAELIVAERLARDDSQWDRMADLWHPDSSVELSWFTGSGAEFTRASGKVVHPDAPNFHVMAPSIVTVRGTRALAETPCLVPGFSKIGGVDCCVQSFVRLMWRARRDADRWLVAGLKCLYIRDMLQVCDPSMKLTLDPLKLSGLRASYRYASYNLLEAGVEFRHDMPGNDQPESVKVLRAGEAAWLGGEDANSR